MIAVASIEQNDDGFRRVHTLYYVDATKYFLKKISEHPSEPEITWHALSARDAFDWISARQGDDEEV